MAIFKSYFDITKSIKSIKFIKSIKSLQSPHAMGYHWKIKERNGRFNSCVNQMQATSPDVGRANR